MIFYIFLIIFQCYNTAVKRLMSFDGMSQSALPTFYQNLKSEILVGTSFDFIICNDFSHCQIILEELFFHFQVLVYTRSFTLATF